MRLVITIPICLAASAAWAQPDDKPVADKPADRPLDARVKALEVDLSDAKGETDDLKSEIADLKAKVAANKPPQSIGAFNPAITAFINAAARADDKAVSSPGGVRIDDRPFVRTAEFDFRAAADPYADAVAILSLEDQAGQGFGVDLEEGYMVIKRLPILESAPLGLKLKVGKFRAPIGNMNRSHMHDLPWTTRPLPISRLLGTENGEFFESGYNAVGADAEVILPTIVKGAVQELNVDIVDGGQIAVSDQSTTEKRHPGYLGHYNLFFTAHDAHDFNFGVSGYYENGDHRVGLVGGDFLYKWKPIKAGEFHSFVLGAEVLYADRKFGADTNGDGMPDTTKRAKPFSWFGFAQYQLSWHVYAGGRYDYVQDIVDTSKTTQLAAGYLSYYTSEFLRFRVGYEHRWSDNPVEDNVNSVIAEVNVVFGSHPTEPYWVNR